MQAQARRGDQAENARKTHAEAHSNERAARLRERYRRTEKEQGEAYRAFTNYPERQRARAVRFAAHLSEAGRAKYLAAFDSTQRRLELFEDWLRSNPTPEVASTMSAAQVDLNGRPRTEPVDGQKARTVGIHARSVGIVPNGIF
jgi:hypothetical protein